MKLRIWILLAVASLAPAITIEQAVKEALRSDPDLVAARASLTVADARVRLAGSLSTPEIRLGANSLAFDPDLFGIRTSAGVRWSPPRPGELRWKREIAQSRQQAAGADIRDAEAKTAAEVRLVFRRVVLDEHRTGQAEQILEVRRQLLDVVRKQVEAGLKDAGDLDLAELDVADAENDLRRARNASGAARRVLGRWLDGEGSARLEAEPELLANPAAGMDSAELAARALRNRGSLLKVSAECRELAAAEGLSRNQRYPWFSFAQISRRSGYGSDRGGVGIPGRTRSSVPPLVAGTGRVAGGLRPTEPVPAGRRGTEAPDPP